MHANDIFVQERSAVALRHLTDPQFISVMLSLEFWWPVGNFTNYRHKRSTPRIKSMTSNFFRFLFTRLISRKEDERQKEIERTDVNRSAIYLSKVCLSLFGTSMNVGRRWRLSLSHCSNGNDIFRRFLILLTPYIYSFDFVFMFCE